MVTPPTGPSPVAAPQQGGIIAGARAKMALATQALIEALGMLKANDLASPEGKAILSSLKGLSSVIPDAAEGLSQSAMMGMQGAAPPVQAAPKMTGMPPAPRPSIVSGPRAMPSMR
jgi:hypothetical protein